MAMRTTWTTTTTGFVLLLAAAASAQPTAVPLAGAAVTGPTAVPIPTEAPGASQSSRSVLIVLGDVKPDTPATNEKPPAAAGGQEKPGPLLADLSPEQLQQLLPPELLPPTAPGGGDGKPEQGKPEQGKPEQGKPEQGKPEQPPKDHAIAPPDRKPPGAENASHGGASIIVQDLTPDKTAAPEKPEEAQPAPETKPQEVQPAPETKPEEVQPVPDAKPQEVPTPPAENEQSKPGPLPADLSPEQLQQLLPLPPADAGKDTQEQAKPEEEKPAEEKPEPPPKEEEEKPEPPPKEEQKPESPPKDEDTPTEDGKPEPPPQEQDTPSEEEKPVSPPEEQTKPPVEEKPVEEKPEEAPEPTPTNSPKPTPTNSPKATPTNSPKATPTNSPKATPSKSPKPTPSKSPKPTPSKSPAPTKTPTPKPVAPPPKAVEPPVAAPPPPQEQPPPQAQAPPPQAQPPPPQAQPPAPEAQPPPPFTPGGSGPLPADLSPEQLAQLLPPELLAQLTGDAPGQRSAQEHVSIEKVSRHVSIYAEGQKHDPKHPGSQSAESTAAPIKVPGPALPKDKGGRGKADVSVSVGDGKKKTETKPAGEKPKEKPREPEKPVANDKPKPPSKQPSNDKPKTPPKPPPSSDKSKLHEKPPSDKSAPPPKLPNIPNSQPQGNPASTDGSKTDASKTENSKKDSKPPSNPPPRNTAGPVKPGQPGASKPRHVNIEVDNNPPRPGAPPRKPTPSDEVADLKRPSVHEAPARGGNRIALAASLGTATLVAVAVGVFALLYGGLCRGRPEAMLYTPRSSSGSAGSGGLFAARTGMRRFSASRDTPPRGMRALRADGIPDIRPGGRVEGGDPMAETAISDEGETVATTTWTDGSDAGTLPTTATGLSGGLSGSTAAREFDPETEARSAHSLQTFTQAWGPVAEAETQTGVEHVEFEEVDSGEGSTLGCSSGCPLSTNSSSPGQGSPDGERAPLVTPKAAVAARYDYAIDVGTTR